MIKHRTETRLVISNYNSYEDGIHKDFILKNKVCFMKFKEVSTDLDTGDTFVTSFDLLEDVENRVKSIKNNFSYILPSEIDDEKLKKDLKLKLNKLKLLIEKLEESCDRPTFDYRLNK